MATATVKYVTLSETNESTISASIKTELESLAPASTDKFGFAVKGSVLYVFKVTTS